MSKQVIPRRVGNLTPVLCDITDDLLNHLTVSFDSGKIEDITSVMTKWAFQSTYISAICRKLLAISLWCMHVYVVSSLDPVTKCFICILIHTDTAYFVFGENIDVYDTADPTQAEFIEAAVEFIKEFSEIQPIPIYNYFPSLAYRKFIRIAKRMRELGKYIL